MRKWARQSNLSGGLSLGKADGWNLKNHSHLTVARRLHEKTHTSMLVVTMREGEERGIVSAALREELSKTRLRNEAWLSVCRTESQQSGETKA